jgi:hypothetical protein
MRTWLLSFASTSRVEHELLLGSLSWLALLHGFDKLRAQDPVHYAIQPLHGNLAALHRLLQGLAEGLRARHLDIRARHRRFDRALRRTPVRHPVGAEISPK